MVLVVAGVAGGAMWWLRGTQRIASVRPARVTEPVRRAAAAVPVPAPAPPRPEPSPVVTLAVTTNPAGARVGDGSDELGTTPLTMSRPRSEREVLLSFELKGYRTAARTVDLTAIPGERQELVVNLMPIPPQEKPRQPAARPSPRSRGRQKAKAKAETAGAPAPAKPPWAKDRGKDEPAGGGDGDSRFRKID